MKNTTSEERIINLMKNASYSSFNAYRSSDIIPRTGNMNSLHLDAGRTKGNLGSASSYAVQAKREISNLINEHNSKLISLISEMNTLSEELANLNQDKLEKRAILDRKNISVSIKSIDQYVGSEWYETEGKEKVKPLREDLNTRKTEVEVDVIDVSFKKANEKSFTHTISELDRTISYSNYASRETNNSRYSSNSEDVRIKMQRSNADSRSASRHADFAVGAFRKEMEVLNKDIIKCYEIIDELTKEISREKTTISRLDKMIKYTDCKLDVLDLAKEINTKKLELSELCKKAGTPLYTNEVKEQAKVLRKEITELEKRR